MLDPAADPQEPPLPVSRAERLRLASRLARGRTPDLSGLTLDELREVWRLVEAQWEIWDWAGLPHPPPELDEDAPRLTPDECRAVLVELGVPSAGRIVEEILQEPLMLAALAAIGAAVAALTLPRGWRP